MTDLYESLTQIYESIKKPSITRAGLEESNYLTRDEFVKSVEQAFKEAGYLPLDTIGKSTFKMSGKPIEDLYANDEVNEVKLMTGQEWYDRFMKEYKKSDHDSYYDLDIIEAAKKASGIE